MNMILVLLNLTVFQSYTSHTPITSQMIKRLFLDYFFQDIQAKGYDQDQTQYTIVIVDLFLDYFFQLLSLISATIYI